jgi:hypothetical protein
MTGGLSLLWDTSKELIWSFRFLSWPAVTVKISPLGEASGDMTTKGVGVGALVGILAVLFPKTSPAIRTKNKSPKTEAMSQKTFLFAYNLSKTFFIGWGILFRICDSWV